jgi:hypothetical protein
MNGLIPLMGTWRRTRGSGDSPLNTTDMMAVDLYVCGARIIKRLTCAAGMRLYFIDMDLVIFGAHN